MADLVFKAYDMFVILYDLLALVKENTTSESLTSAVRLSPSAVSQMMSLLLAQGFIKTARNDSEFRITALGSNFLRDFQGMRRFLS
jgi:predicted transcriptional regulator